MTRLIRKFVLTMIIGVTPICAVHAQSWFGGETRLPDPVAFSTQMELGDLGQAEAWLDAGLPADFLGSRIGSGLMIGAWEGNIALMRLFISRGADINQLNANGESALALAAWRGKMEAARWLVERGARINAPARRWSPLHYAVFAGNEEMMEYLIGLGADINARSTNGSTVLMMAVYEGREGLARKLIEKGADRSPKNDWGDGALEWAMRADNLSLARLVSNPEAFNIAVAKPKESWGEPSRSLRMSKELESLLEMRKVLVDRGMSTDGIDRRIAAERVRIVRETLDRPGPQRASVIEVSADRQSGQQSVRVVPADKPAGGGFKVPPTNFHGQPKMPLKIPTKNY